MPKIQWDVKSFTKHSGLVAALDRMNIDTDQIIPKQFLKRIERTGYGSSREHAPWALQEYRFRCIIAASFSDIFYNNCFQNGLFPLVLPEAHVRELFRRVDAFRRECLLQGLDEIGSTLRHEDKIRAYESRQI